MKMVFVVLCAELAFATPPLNPLVGMVLVFVVCVLLSVWLIKCLFLVFQGIGESCKEANN